MNILRILFYAAAMVVLAFGLTLNVQTGLGVSPIISVAYAVAEVSGLNFADVTFALYSVFVAAEVVIHSLILRMGRVQLAKDLLQLPLSLVFTRFMALFQMIIPDVSQFPMWARISLLIAAVAATGIGAAGSLAMDIVPNPGDGIVNAIAGLAGWSVGFAKNAFDAFNVVLCCIIGLLFEGRVVGIGIGTLIAVAGVGRVIALYKRTVGDMIVDAAGIA